MSGQGIRKVGVLPLLTAATSSSATSSGVEPYHTNRSFEAFGSTASGSGAATILIEVQNSENSDWHTLCTFTLTLGTSVAGDGAVSNAAWRYVRARVTALSGTGASVSVNMGTAPL